jgi:hypothetical protein
MSTTTRGNQVRRHFFKYRILRLGLLRGALSELVCVWQVVGAKDLVLTSRESSDRKNEPELVREVLLGHVDARGNAVLLEILMQLLHEHQFARRFYANPKYDLLLA